MADDLFLIRRTFTPDRQVGALYDNPPMFGRVVDDGVYMSYHLDIATQMTAAEAVETMTRLRTSPSWRDEVVRVSDVIPHPPPWPSTHTSNLKVANKVANKT